MKKPVKGFKDNSGKLVDEQDFVDKLKEIAEQELGWWSGKTEKDAAGEERINDEYIKLLYPRGLTLGDDEFDPKKDAWSALFIVYVVWKAAQDLDLETPPLARTVRHIMYAHQAYEKREADATGNYWALPRSEPPQIGDIVVKQRMSSTKTSNNGKTVIERFFRPRIQFRELVEKDWGETHGDLVTATGSTLTVIGGNVSDTVKEASYNLKDGVIDSECLCGVAWPSKGKLSRADYRRYIEKKYDKTVCPNNNQCLVFTVLRLSPVAGYVGSTGTQHRHLLAPLKVPDADDKSVVSAVWKSEYARREEAVKLEGQTAGIAGGTAATLEIHRHDPGGSHTVVEQLSGTVEDDTVTADWTFEYEGDVEELPDVNEGAEEYLPPRYFFQLTADGESARSGLLEFKDRMELELVDKDGEAIPNLQYTVRFADGSEDGGAVDDQGKAELVDIPPGKVRVVFSSPALADRSSPALADRSSDDVVITSIPPVVFAPDGSQADSTQVPRVELQGISFKSDHGLLNDNVTDWTSKGKVFDRRTYDLDDERPLSQTKNTKLKVKLKLFFHNLSGKRRVKIVGTGGADHFNFQKIVTIDGKREWPELDANAPLPDRVHMTQVPVIRWQAEVDGNLYEAGQSLPHDLFVTYDTPIVPSLSKRRVEDGVTIKRMVAAVKLVEDTGGDSPHEIVSELMKKFGITVLQPDVDRDPGKFAPAVRFGGPQYFEDLLGGAWPIAENVELSGECQAISRFVSGVLHQVGVPGITETILVYADDRDGGAKALTERFQKGVNGGLGKARYLRKRTHKEDGSRILDSNNNPIEINEQLQLMSRTLLQIVKPLETEVEIRDSRPNAYEATLHFTDPSGVSKYYPAGTFLAPLDSPQEVLEKTFTALTWVSAHGPKDDTFFIIWKIVKRY